MIAPARNLETRRLRLEDFEGLSRLYTEVYQVDQDRNYWEWKYFRNPHGEHIMYVAADGEKIVGEVGCIPVRVKWGEETVPATQTCDITILPSYQKGGPFFKLHDLSFKEHIDKGFRFIYGFSIPKTLKISSRLLQFRPICPVRRWALILDPEPYIRRKISVPVLSSILGAAGRAYKRFRLRRHLRAASSRVAEVKRFDARFDRFWEERRADRRIMVARDGAYLNWRYADHPTGRYKILAFVADNRVKGFMVLTTGRDELRRGIVMEFLTDPADPAASSALLGAALRFFLEERAEMVMLWLPENDPAVPFFERAGFVRRSTNHHLIARIVPSGNGDKNPGGEELFEPSHWYFSMGDSDYY